MLTIAAGLLAAGLSLIIGNAIRRAQWACRMSSRRTNKKHSEVSVITIACNLDNSEEQMAQREKLPKRVWLVIGTICICIAILIFCIEFYYPAQLL